MTAAGEVLVMGEGQPEAAPPAVMPGPEAPGGAAATPARVRVIDRIRQRRQRGMRWIAVPEWDAKLGFGCLTAADLRAVKDRAPKDDMEKSLLLLIHKATEEDGSPSFQFGDLEWLLREADLTVLNRVLDFMYGATVGLEEAKKEVGEATASAS